jgi:hypothetical protein
MKSLIPVTSCVSRAAGFHCTEVLNKNNLEKAQLTSLTDTFPPTLESFRLSVRLPDLMPESLQGTEDTDDTNHNASPLLLSPISAIMR